MMKIKHTALMKQARNAHIQIDRVGKVELSDPIGVRKDQCISALKSALGFYDTTQSGQKRWKPTDESATVDVNLSVDSDGNTLLGFEGNYLLKLLAEAQKES